MFIKTTAAEHVLKCIKENSCVTITGSSGVGKTATLRHIALQMTEEGYDVLLVTEPSDIVKFYNPTQKVLFVVDDLCGNVAVNLRDFQSMELNMDDIKYILENKKTKIIAACRLQVYQDEKFESLSVFNSCVCNLQSENMRLSKTEKQSIAKLYLKTKASEIADCHDLYDAFPLLCKLCHDNPKLDIKNFFQNPFSVYETEIDKLLKNGYYTKYCALALCVMFNNKLKEEILTEDVNEETRTIIENTFEACRLDRGTSRLSLLYELDSLMHIFIKKELNMYQILHDKIFDFFAKIYGQKIMLCLIKNADSGLIKERFLLERKDGMDQFITIIPTKYHQMYIQRMIDDWSKGKLQDVFSNINMKIPVFRQKFLCYLKTLDMSHQRQLAHTCDDNYKDTVLLRCCFIGDSSLIRWCLIHDANINQSRCDGVTPLIAACHKGHTETVSLLVQNNADLDKCSKDGLTPLFAAKGQGHTEIVKLLLENKAKIFDRRDDSSKDDRIPIAIRKMEPWSIELYLKTLKSGSEKRRDLTLVVVGKKGAGKTSLVRRLFGEELTNLESTNGIEIHRRQCKIKSDQWTKKADKDSDFNKRILESVVEQLYLNEKEQILSESSPGMLDKNIYPNIAESLDEEEIVIDDKVDVIYGKIADDNDVIYERVVDKDEVNNDRIESSRQEIDISVPVLVQETDQPSNEIMQTSEQIASKELSAFSDTDVVLKDDEDFTTLTLWDFAGDEEFYATHQTFLNPDAVYILVANLNDKDKDNANHEHGM
ncbi:Hypothetical predicted protein [Mytilus galloprovincialis]|uniref:Roc domain-containing protein n=1 Tax=Mytilus galloprovincialis TaxID=29158 RepID=A0A8B6BX09_MYTGA|nr:Hypothetical predicted protein [Mytilus galloprovincialis]